MGSHLIQATWLPARHVKPVRAQLDGLLEDKSFTLFEPSIEMLGPRGLQMEDGAVEPDKNGLFTLEVQNHSLEPVCLKKRQVLGKLHPATLVGTSTPIESPVELEVQTITSMRGGGEETVISDAVEKSLEGLPEEALPLRKVLTKYPELFADNDIDLGCTEVVRLHIKTLGLTHRFDSPLLLPCEGKWRRWLGRC